MPKSVETKPVIEIRDSTLDGEAIAQRIYKKVTQRRQAGAYEFENEAFSEPLVDPERDAGLDQSALRASFPGLQANLNALTSEGYLREPVFTSSIPILGKFIVAVRRFWNWMSTKWYVRPILQQQSDHNIYAALVVNALAQWHALDSRRIRELEHRVAELEAQCTKTARFEEESEA